MPRCAAEGVSALDKLTVLTGALAEVEAAARMSAETGPGW